MAVYRDVDVLGLDYAKKFTQAYKAGSAQNKYVRESLCEDVQFPRVLVSPRKTDLLCGKRLYPEVGYSPQVGGMGFYFDTTSWDGENPVIKYSQTELEEWKALREFWSNEATAAKCLKSFSPEIRGRLPGVYDGGKNLDYPAYALFRMSGLQVNLKKLGNIGIGGLEEEVTCFLNNANDPESVAFFQSALHSVFRIKKCVEYYIGKAQELPPSQKTEKMLRALSGILYQAPATFHEGLQLVLLVQTIAGVINFGRLDTVLGPLWENDLATGRISWEEALELMENFYTIIEEEIWHFDGRIVIGGVGRENEAAADKFAMLAMETTERLSLPMPQLTLRFYQGQNEELISKAYDVIGQGKTFPMLYNDDVNVPAVEKAFRIDRQTAEQYIPFGCGEYMIENRSCGTPNFIINLQMCLELAMNNGRRIHDQKRLAPDYGAIANYQNFEQLLGAYEKTVTYFLEVGALAQYQIYEGTGKECPFSLISVLYDNCLEKGRSIFDGGIEFLGGTNETYGNNNTADSLTAIDELVYSQRKYSAEELLTALKADWQGYETMQKAFREAPKFGNDNDTADRMQMRVHDHVCNETQGSIVGTGLHHFLVVIINNNHNTLWGRQTSASADGRNHGDPLVPGNSAAAGSDRNGLTALLNSQAKPDPSIHAGAVQNVKVSSAFPAKNKDLYRVLFNTYFLQGGTQIMITTTNRDDLIAALETPEKYANLLVRVGGFSARFIDLDLATQMEVISRTEY
ncbi:pyruvate formate lyase family protein [Sunxiuqinia indica]|uniref:pyruvate formate lyase family protein n=1 Tax=Sunxiuqinia indica TaxID=2692584 RepID=UPI00135B76DE|nr:pyruvate formate lyase family protein [Sunxiuqinia indica]